MPPIRFIIITERTNLLSPDKDYETSTTSVGWSISSTSTSKPSTELPTTEPTATDTRREESRPLLQPFTTSAVCPTPEPKVAPTKLGGLLPRQQRRPLPHRLVWIREQRTSSPSPLWSEGTSIQPRLSSRDDWRREGKRTEQIRGGGERTGEILQLCIPLLQPKQPQPQSGERSCWSEKVKQTINNQQKHL